MDVGSGGGTPGIPLAASLPEREVTLLEAERRKTEFLQRWTGELPNLRVIWGRAESQVTDCYKVAVAKALAQPPVAAEWCLPLVAEGGAVILWVGPVGRPGGNRPRCREDRRRARRVAAGLRRDPQDRPDAAGLPAPARHREEAPARLSAYSARLGVAQPHAAELERRGDDVVPERPEARQDAELDLRVVVQRDEVSERTHLERLDRLAADPVAADAPGAARRTRSGSR